MTGFEPATSCSQSRRSSQAELHPGNVSLVVGLDVVNQAGLELVKVYHLTKGQLCQGKVQCNQIRKLL